MLVLMFVQFLRSWFLAFSLQMETSPRGRSSFAFQTALFKLCRFYSPSKLGKESLQSSFVFYDESCMLCLHDSQSDASIWKLEVVPYPSFIRYVNSFQTLPKPRTSFITSILILFWVFVKKNRVNKMKKEVKWLSCLDTESTTNKIFNWSVQVQFLIT